MARAKEPAPGLLDATTAAKPLVPGITGGITTAMVAEAEAYSRRQLMFFAKWLKVDETKLDPADRELCDRVLATVNGDGTAYQKALAYPPVNRLFAAGVLFFEPPASSGCSQAAGPTAG